MESKIIYVNSFASVKEALEQITPEWLKENEFEYDIKTVSTLRDSVEYYLNECVQLEQNNSALGKKLINNRLLLKQAIAKTADPKKMYDWWSKENNNETESQKEVEILHKRLVEMSATVCKLKEKLRG